MGTPRLGDGRLSMETNGVLLARMGEVRTAKIEPKIGCHGLGSCIGLIAYDSTTKAGGVAHVVLPESTGHKDLSLPARYMDLGVQHLIELTVKAGADASRLRFAAVGGANVFKFGAGSPSLNLSIGDRNIKALHEQFSALRLRLIAERVGGTEATSTQLCLVTGQVFVASGRREMELLCSLGNGSVARLQSEGNYARAA